MARGEISWPKIAPAAFSIDEFCTAHGFSRRATFYNLQAEGQAPDVMRVRGRVLITAEAAARWRKRKTTTSARGG